VKRLATVWGSGSIRAKIYGSVFHAMSSPDLEQPNASFSWGWCCHIIGKIRGRSTFATDSWMVVAFDEHITSGRPCADRRRHVFAPWERPRGQV